MKTLAKKVNGSVQPLFFVMLIFASTLIVYQKAPHNTFHLDDFPNIVRHFPVHMSTLSIDGLVLAGSESRIATRPLASVSFAIDWWRGGGEPRAFLQTNMILHAATAAALFAFIHLLLVSTGTAGRVAAPAAAAGALLWALHPINTQAVTYIVQRMTMLAACAVLISLFCFLRGRLTSGARRGAWMFAALVFAAAGALSKENALILPLLVLGIEYGVLRDRDRLLRGGTDILLVLLPVAAAIYVVADIFGGGPLADVFLADYAYREFTLAERLLTQPRVVVFYLSLILWPHPGRFSIEHDFPVSTSLIEPAATLPALGLVALWLLLGIRLLLARGRRLTGFLLLWPPATLAMESSFLPLEMVFEHRMYLPATGLAALGAVGLARASRARYRSRAFLPVVVLFLLAASATATWQRIPAWSTRIGLTRDALTHAPGSARLWRNYGVYALEVGDMDEARRAAAASLALDPNDPHALELAALVAMEKGDVARAERLLDQALGIQPDNPTLLNHRGEAALERRLFRQAAWYFQRAQYRLPWNPVYAWNLALALEGLDDCRGALRQWRRFLELSADPQDEQRVKDHIEEHYESAAGKCRNE